MTINDLSNKYTDAIASKKIEGENLMKALKKNNENMQKNLKNSKLLLGDDSKVEETLLISFLGDMLKSIQEGIYIYNEMLIKKKIDVNEDRISELKNNVELNKQMEKQKERVENIQEFNRLRIREKALEKMNQRTSSPIEKQKNEFKIKDIVQKMENIKDTFEFAGSMQEFIERTQNKELELYGEEAYNKLQELRELPENIIQEFEKAGVSLESLANNDNLSFEAIQNITNNITNEAVSETLDTYKDTTQQQTQQQTL